MPTAEHIAHLIYQELEGNLSEVEATELQDWRTENPEHQTFFDNILDEDGFAEMARVHHPENKETIRRRILAKIEDRLSFKVVPLYRRGFFRVAVAACLAALILVGGYLVFFNKPDESTPTVAKSNDVEAPKTDKAVIQLADGTIIPVDSLSTYQQGNVTVTRMEDGRLVYSGLGTEVVFNTLTNPRGSKVIDMTLADGSRVWLNAGSSIHYPIAFPGKERRIETTGEVYVKVAKNTAQPFIASTNGMEVLALGTEFNINSYSDEDDIRTTLIEGSVKVTKGTANTVLKPGQQTILNSNGQLGAATPVNIDEIVAWKDGWFHFESADLKTILRQFARWYDVEVIYEGPVKNRKFFAVVKRSSTLQSVLEMLQDNNIIYRVEGKKLVVKSG